MDDRFRLCVRAVLASIGGLMLFVPLGCVEARRPDFTAIQAHTKAPWGKNVDDAAAVGQGSVIAWWRDLGDPVLQELMKEALGANLDLAMARQRVIAAQARRGVRQADRLPRLDGTSEYLRAGVGDDALAFAVPRPGVETDLFSVGVVAGWELDLWGRIEQLVEAAEGDIEAAVATYQDAAVSLLAEVALAYVDVRTLEKRVELVEQNLALQRRTLQLVESRVTAGTAAELEVARTNRLIERTRARLPVLRQARRVSQNRLALLLGRRPAAEPLPRGDLPVVVPPTDVGVPADLLTRRPDIRRAAWNYRAALARATAADLERYPRVRLNGTFQLSSDHVGGWLDESFVYTVGPNVRVPLFDAGRIDANVAVRDAEAERARLTLEKVLLQALGEVENAAAGLVQGRQRVELLVAALDAARRSVELADQRFESGLRDQFQVLDAQRELVEIEDDLAVARQDVLSETIGLYRALGGGWRPVPLDPENEPLVFVPLVEGAPPAGGKEPSR